ncbi:MAG: hypothetical protein L3K08_02180 [Thermoplasmata archaeon]|nr:hypothetical protein [Thermoplasmata archaeon]
MVLSPVAAASHVTPAVKAPFKNSSVAVYSYSSVNGCGTGNVTHAPRWSATTGIGTFASKQSVKTCGGYWGTHHLSSSATTTTDFEVALAIHPTSFTSYVEVKMNFVAAGTESIHFGGTCGSVTYVDSYGNGSEECVVQSQVYAYWEVLILDTTTNTYVTSVAGLLADNSSYAYALALCVAYSCAPYSGTYGGTSSTLSVSQTNTSDLFGTYTGSHTYELITIVEEQSYSAATFSEYPQFQPGGTFSGSAAASFNMATGGDKATLTSVKYL